MKSKSILNSQFKILAVCCHLKIIVLVLVSNESDNSRSSRKSSRDLNPGHSQQRSSSLSVHSFANKRHSDAGIGTILSLYIACKNVVIQWKWPIICQYTDKISNDMPAYTFNWPIVGSKFQLCYFTSLVSMLA